MCGIAGIIRRDGPVDRADLERMAERQRHRGPDDSGLWIAPDGRAGLSHRRLAIIDPSSDGRQPMSCEENDHHLVFNGEIYNFVALRRELEEHGHRFRTRTDTEVILRGYRQWGDDVVQRLHGMFAFAVWDEPRRRLLLARDRLGIKPLHWTHENGELTFASELKGILAGPPRGRAVDASALWDFLTCRYVPAPKTAFRGVHKLPPAHVLVLEGGRVDIRPYWDVEFVGAGSGHDEEPVEELLALLRTSVRDHLVSDRPLGVLLSGGIDSSAVTAFATEAGGPMKSFSVAFGASAQCEARFARAVAERFGTDHVEVEYDTLPPLDLADRLTEWFDEPFGDPSALPSAQVCGVARRAVTVALSGDGGDELFGGYRRYGKLARWRTRDGLPRAVRGPLAFALGRMCRPLSRPARTLQRWGAEEIARHAMLHGGMTREDKRQALPRSVFRRFQGYDDYWSFRPHWREDLDPWSCLQYVDLKTYLPDNLLTKIDRVSMQVSLEVRPPLLDHRIVEFAATIPTEQRVGPGERKRILKRALAGILGPESLDRGKQGFSPSRDGALLASAEGTAGWPEPLRLNWAYLALWTRTRLGVEDPREILREGP